jgi:hypothetical protein
MLADENGDRLRAADRVLERRDPAQAWTKLAAVEEGAEALGAEPAVQFRSGGAVAMGVTQKNIVGVAAPQGASLVFAARQSIPLIRSGGATAASSWPVLPAHRAEPQYSNRIIPVNAVIKEAIGETEFVAEKDT